MPRPCSGKPQSESVPDRGGVHFGVGPYRALWGGSWRLAKLSRNCEYSGHRTPPRPDLLLRTARICLKLRRPRRAYDALAAVNAIDVRQIADPDRTAEQITNIAAVLCARRLRAEAKDMLHSAIALAPRAAAPRSALILLLEEDLRAAGGNISLEQWAELENLCGNR